MLGKNYFPHFWKRRMHAAAIETAAEPILTIYLTLVGSASKSLIHKTMTKFKFQSSILSDEARHNCQIRLLEKRVGYMQASYHSSSAQQHNSLVTQRPNLSSSQVIGCTKFQKSIRDEHKVLLGEPGA